MQINYDEIVTENYSELIDNETLQTLKKIALDERKLLDYKLRNKTGGIKYYLLMKKAIEFANIRQENLERNKYEKSILINNIIFSNEQCAKILNSGNFDRETLQTFIALVNYANRHIEKATKQQIHAINTFTKSIVTHFQKYVGIIKPEIIINKINEVLIYQPELLESKSNKHTR